MLPLLKSFTFDEEGILDDRKVNSAAVKITERNSTVISALRATRMRFDVSASIFNMEEKTFLKREDFLFLVLNLR